MFGNGSPRRLDLIDNKGINALIADRGRCVPEEHLRLTNNPANCASQRGESLELSNFLVARAE
jgi:hypothetical protein